MGNAYRFSLPGGEGLSKDAWLAAGGNASAIHVDVMIGSGAMQVTGITQSGTVELLMQAGEWAFNV